MEVNGRLFLFYNLCDLLNGLYGSDLVVHIHN